MKKPNKQHLTARINPNLYRLLEGLRDLQGISRSALIEKAIELYLSIENPEATQQKSA
jgi:metal-responsive CopG/Arc/MetJ family transcriptional regulator